MDFWNILEYAAWALSAIIFVWLLTDAAKVSREYNEALLTSSREGELEQASEEHKL